MKFTISFGMRLLLVACLFCFCFIIASIGLGLISYGHADSAQWMRIATVIQDILVFIMPAILTAFLVTRTPADLLCLRKGPQLRITLLAILAMIVATPAMELVIAWNESWTLPASLHSLEEAMRTAEEAARNTIALVIGPHTIANVILAVLLVGVLAGFSEEIFFRGTIQRLLTTGCVNPHLAIWLTAFIFSAVHFQIFGLVPRLLLGAFFGYMLFWSRSLWLPVLLHALNNSIYVISDYLRDGAPESHFSINATTITVAVISAIATALLLALIHRLTCNSAKN